MSGNTNITLSALDPNTLKQQFIQWLGTQSIFTDYYANGSNMSVELDLLARNTFLNSFLLNMVFSEGYNDSAQLRNSLVSKSKDLNYLPQSTISSSTILDITIQTANLTTFEIPKGCIFQGLNSNGTYSFVTDQNYIGFSSNGTFNFSNVAIYDGFYLQDIFTVDNSQENQLFTLSNPGVDTSSLVVTVSEDAGSTTSVFTQVPNLYGLSNTSQIFFLQGAEDSQYQFQFGDGILGYIPQDGSVVTANYRVATGEAANFITSFGMVSSLSNLNNGAVQAVTITTSGPTSGGADEEGIESIRFNNPRHYQTQENAVTGGDYKDIILQNYPSLKDVNVYSGGITPTAVQYGIVFVAAISQSGNPITQNLKDNIITFLTDLSLLNIPTQIVDPDYLYLEVSSNVHVDFTQTNIAPNQYKLLVTNNIIQFSNSNLETFSTPFRYSVLTDGINAIDPSIISNETTINLKKLANPILNTNTSISINYNNPIVNVVSSTFLIGANTYFLTDVINNNINSGVVYLTQISTNNTIASSVNVGTVNYSKGIVSISPLNISGYTQSSSGLSFYAAPQNQDQYAVGNMIIEIDPLGININIANN